MQETSLLLKRQPCHEQFCRGNKEELKVSKNSSSGMVKVSSVAVLQWNVCDAVSAMVLSTPAMDNDVRGEASFTWMHMARALVRQPAIGDQEVLSLFVQLTVGVLSHQAAM